MTRRSTLAKYTGNEAHRVTKRQKSAPVDAITASPDRFSRRPTPSHGVDLVDPPLVSPTLERRFQPHLEYRLELRGRHEPLANGQHVRIVVQARVSRRLHVPAQRASHARNAVRHDRFTIARSAEHDSALEFAQRDREGNGANELRVVHRFIGARSEVRHIMAPARENFLDALLVMKTRVIGTDGDAHEST